VNQPLLLDDCDEFFPKAVLWGEPSIGKGAAIRKFPNVIEMRMSVIDIADIRGLPTVPHKGEEDALR
jgi:hypothetical protein